jgi:DNA-directed RNA polymerase I subunit RPA2
VNGHVAVPERLELHTIYDFSDRLYPGVYLTTSAARLSRAVKYLGGSGADAPDSKDGYKVEWIHPMEQQFMDIACVPSDFRKGETTHMEFAPENMLSVIASLTPFSDFNQSPRNM